MDMLKEKEYAEKWFKENLNQAELVKLENILGMDGEIEQFEATVRQTKPELGWWGFNEKGMAEIKRIDFCQKGEISIDLTENYTVITITEIKE